MIFTQEVVTDRFGQLASSLRSPDRTWSVDRSVDFESMTMNQLLVLHSTFHTRLKHRPKETTFIAAAVQDRLEQVSAAIDHF